MKIMFWKKEKKEEALVIRYYITARLNDGTGKGVWLNEDSTEQDAIDLFDEYVKQLKSKSSQVFILKARNGGVAIPKDLIKYIEWETRKVTK